MNNHSLNNEEAFYNMYTNTPDNEETFYNMDSKLDMGVYHLTRIIMLLIFFVISIYIINNDIYPEVGYPNSGDIVYITEYGHRYHNYRNCQSLKNSTTVQRIEFDEYGDEFVDLTPCRFCEEKSLSKYKLKKTVIWIIIFLIISYFVWLNKYLFFILLGSLIMLCFGNIVLAIISLIALVPVLYLVFNICFLAPLYAILQLIVSLFKNDDY